MALQSLVKIKRGRGRPSKLTPETIKKLTDALVIGSTYEAASLYAGISYQTFNHWMGLGEVAQSGDYSDFYYAVKAAIAQGIVRNLKTIDDAANPVKGNDWRAAAWRLERTHSQSYGAKRNEHVPPQAESADIKITEIIVQGPAKGPVLLDDDNPRRDD